MDILCITPFDTVSLKLLKTKGYFTDLSSSAILSKQVSRLYPGLQKGLTTDDGKIIGWYETVETYLPDATMDVLEQNGHKEQADNIQAELEKIVKYDETE